MSALQLQLTDAESRVVTQRPIDDPVAYDCYLRARNEMYLFTPAALDRAQRLVDTGLAIIGENALLLATKGLVSWYYVNFSIRPEKRYPDEAAACAANALAQDPQGYLGIFVRGLVAARRGDIESALRGFRRAYELKPGEALVMRELTRHVFSAGQEQSQVAQLVLEELLRVDPLAPLNWAQSAWRHIAAGRLVEGVVPARRVPDLTEPGNLARTYAAYYIALASLREEAIGLFDQVGAALEGRRMGP